MITITPEFKAFLAETGKTAKPLATCWLTVREDGMIFAATNHQRDIVFDLETAFGTLGIPVPPKVVGTGLQTYLASAGYTRTDIASASDLSVDSMEVQGMLNSVSLTDDDLHAGKWNDTFVCIFTVNYTDLTMLMMVSRVGTLGQVMLKRSTFVAELNGVVNALQTPFGGLINPLCPYNLGDYPHPAPYRGRCGLDLSGSSSGSPATPWIVTGTIEAVSDDQLTLFDSARTEPGPSGGIAITAISNSNPCVITTATPMGLAEGEAVTLSNLVDPALLNATAAVHNPSGNTFEINVDTSDTIAYPPYSGSGGLATPAGEDSGWFDYGLFEALSGLNASGDSPPSGNKMEVKSYVPGQWTLQLPMPYAMAAGDNYRMVVGDNKTFSTCKNKFGNQLNFGGYPFVPGQDNVLQVAKPSAQQSDSKK